MSPHPAKRLRARVVRPNRANSFAKRESPIHRQAVPPKNKRPNGQKYSIRNPKGHVAVSPEEPKAQSTDTNANRPHTITALTERTVHTLPDPKGALDVGASAASDAGGEAAGPKAEPPWDNGTPAGPRVSGAIGICACADGAATGAGTAAAPGC